MPVFLNKLPYALCLFDSDPTCDVTFHPADDAQKRRDQSLAKKPGH